MGLVMFDIVYPPGCFTAPPLLQSMSLSSPSSILQRCTRRDRYYSVFIRLQVLNQTSRLEIQLLEYSLFTNRLEKHILLQTQEISRLGDKNR